MKKGISQMTVEEVIDHFLQDRGLDIEDGALRAQYSRDLIRRAQRGDSEALVELLKIGTHRTPGTRMFE